MRRFAAGLLLFLAPFPAAALSDAPYLTRDQFDVVHVLAPPPAPGSPEERRDLQTIVEMQQTSSPERTRLAEKDATSGLDAFAGVLGLDPGQLPGVAAFFRKVGRDTQFATTTGKDCWERPRPFVRDSQIHPPGMMQQEVASPPGEKNTAPHGAGSPCPPLLQAQAYSWSYPSGHSTRGALTAILLAEMVPEKSKELFTRGWDFGESRVIGGVHYPSDVEAGRIDATTMATVMLLNPAFRADLGAARRELRKALGLEQ